MKFLGERISYQKQDGVFSVVIAANVEKGYERLLLAWLILWTASLCYFGFQLFGDYTRELKLYIGILLSFMLYYEFRIGRVYFWRKNGYESLKFTGDQLILKEVTLGRSLPKPFYIQNIEKFVADMPKATNVLDFLNNSFWVKGAPYIKFQHQGTTIMFGRQLNELERKSLVTILNKELAQRKKKV